MDNQQAEKETLDALLKKVHAPPAGPDEAAAAFAEISALPEIAEADPRRVRADLFRSVHLKVKVELGRVHLPLREALALGPGSVVDLEKLADDLVDVYVNDLLVARGEVLVVNDCFCVRITEVISQADAEEGER